MVVGELCNDLGFLRITSAFFSIFCMIRCIGYIERKWTQFQQQQQRQHSREHSSSYLAYSMRHKSRWLQLALSSYVSLPRLIAHEI